MDQAFEQPMADILHFVSATQRHQWDLSRQTQSVVIWTFKNSNSFLFSPQAVALSWFSGPYLPRRVAQSAWEYSASGCPSSAVACVLCKPLGRVSLDAHADEQRREQAEARVHFFWYLFFGQTKKSNSPTGEKRWFSEQRSTSTRSSLSTSPSIVSKLSVNFAWIPASAGMTTIQSQL